MVTVACRPSVACLYSRVGPLACRETNSGDPGVYVNDVNGSNCPGLQAGLSAVEGVWRRILGTFREGSHGRWAAIEEEV